MTKERRLAIEMWKQIVEALEHGEYDSCFDDSVAVQIKSRFCHEHNLDWKYNCWFCQYVRKDYRDLTTRCDIPEPFNGCQKCPLYKEQKNILDYDECGCTDRTETLWIKVARDDDVEAAKRILKLLEGNE